MRQGVLILKRLQSYNVSLIDQAMVSGVNFLTGIVLANFLGLKGFGVYSLAWVLILFVCCLQAPLIISPLLTMATKKKGEDRLRFLKNNHSLQVFFAFISGFVAFVFVEFCGGYSGFEMVEEFSAPVALVVIFHQLQDYYRRYCFVLEKNAVVLILDFFRYPVMFFVLIFLGYRDELTVVVCFNVISFVSVFSILVFYFLVRDELDVFGFAINGIKDALCEQWIFSKWLVGSSLLQWFSGNILTVAAASILGVWAAGLIKAVQNVVGVLHILYQGLENSVTPRAAEIYHNGGNSALTGFVVKVFLLGGGFTLMFSLIINLFAETLLINIYDESFVVGVDLLLWFTVIYFLMFIGFSLRLVLKTIERTKPLFWSYVFSSVAIFLLSDWLISNYGVVGVGIGGMVSQVISIVVMMFVVIKYYLAIERREGLL